MGVYLDHNATTPVSEAVWEAMSPFFFDRFGNPSGRYRLGRDARHAIDVARQQVSELVNVDPTQVVFTSGGTEANNTIVKGRVFAATDRQVAISSVEHASIRETAKSLAKLLRSLGQSVECLEIPVDQAGRVTVTLMTEFLEQYHPSFVSIMLANNETGVLQDIAALSDLLKEKNIIFHTDAVQAAGKIAVDFRALGVHAMSLSSHKMYGPKGVGALVIDKSIHFKPLMHGGGHERGYRSGTENVAAIVGFGKAAELANEQLAQRNQHLLKLRRRFEAQLNQIPDVTIFSQQVRRLPNTSYFAVSGIDGETLLMRLDAAGFYVASGSACASGIAAPSSVLLAMQVSPDDAKQAVRVSFGEANNEMDVDRLISALKEQIKFFRSLPTIAMN